jgi:general secretion pathway protein E
MSWLKSGKPKQPFVVTGDAKEDLIQRLQKQGYEVERNAIIEGKSGAHRFDILARHSDSVVSYTIALDMMISKNGSKIGLSELFAFDDKAYDCDIKDKAVVAMRGLDPPAANFAQSQHIKVFDKKSLEAFLASPIEDGKASRKGSPRITTKSQLIKALNKAGYKLEEKAKVRGKSGTEYSFDILAYRDDGFMLHKLAIDVWNGDEEISLERVSSFDAKAYDAGIDHKFLVISNSLSSETSRFAREQGITILESNSSALSWLSFS